MLTRIKTALIYGLVMAVLLVPGYWLPDYMLILLTLLGLLASHEMSQALAKRGYRISARQLVTLYYAFWPAYFYLRLSGQAKSVVSGQALLSDPSQLKNMDSRLLLTLCLIYGLTMALISLYQIFKPLLKEGAKALPEALVALGAGYYISLPIFAAFLLVFALAGGWWLFLLALVTPWVADSAAYFAGRKWGKKPIVPALSPNKTYVGFYGSVVGSLVFFFLLYIWLLPKFLPASQMSVKMGFFVCVIGGVLGALIELGDWLASAIKRACGIKDFSNLLPGHGGVIDRFDSTFFTFISILAIALLAYFF